MQVTDPLESVPDRAPGRAPAGPGSLAGPAAAPAGREAEDTRVSILIVDDLPEKLLVFETVLGDLNQNLVFARSGADALRQILRRHQIG